MDYFEQRFGQLLSQLLDGQLESHEEAELLRLCEAKPERGQRVRQELQLAELLKQAVQEESVAADSMIRPVEAIIGPEPEGQWDELESRLLSGEISPAELEQLAAHGWRSPESARRLYRSLQQEDLLDQAASSARSAETFVESLATRMWAQQEEDQFVSEVATKIIALHPEESIPEEAGEPERGREHASAFSYFGGWAAAAAAIILLTAALLFQPGGGGPVTTVAEISRADGDIRWSDASKLPVFADESGNGGLCLVPGKYALDSGVISLAFLSGAEMTVEGPVEFEIISEQEAYVHSGLAILAKNSAQPGNRFRLRTDALDLGDRGETIGLIADGSSAAEAVIFDGDGRVCLPSAGPCRQMFALEPVRADLDKQKLFDIPYNPAVFAKAWQAMAGVVSNLGPINLVVPGSELDEGPANEVQVIVEKSHFVSSDAIEVDTLESGQMIDATTGAGRSLEPTDRELRSYLVQLRSDDDGEESGDPVVASLTFDHEVVGVIYTRDRLNDSDSIVGVTVDQKAGVGYTNRGLESGKNGDQILLSDDRRTLDLKLGGEGQDSLDHVRVLVALR